MLKTVPGMNQYKKILVLGEETQILTKALRNLGYSAYSNDLKPCSGGHPEWHLQCNGLELLNDDWYQIFAFPPCTYLSKAGLWMCNYQPERKQKQLDAVNFVKTIYYSKCPRIVIENPQGILPKLFIPYSQMVQPYMFGDPWRKDICLWLKGVPRLKIPPRKLWSVKRPPVTHRVNGRMSQALKSELKSKFFHRLAAAMAAQLTVDSPQLSIFQNNNSCLQDE